MNIFHKRQGQMGFQQAYFYTDTIHNFYPLLVDDTLKMVIINSWQNLVNRKLVEIYAYVIMPNHIHLIWQQNKLNGKETPKGSLLKYTGHELLKLLKAEGKSNLYEVNAANKKHEIWQRDSLA